MPIIYHDQSPEFVVPNDWIKDEKFKPYDVNDQNVLWNEGVDRGIRYRLTSKHEHLTLTVDP